MNIHEHQAKEVLKSFGAPVALGVAITSVERSTRCPVRSGW
jgi:succinyl-CoA synthetase beta subunit